MEKRTAITGGIMAVGIIAVVVFGIGHRRKSSSRDDYTQHWLSTKHASNRSDVSIRKGMVGRGSGAIWHRKGYNEGIPFWTSRDACNACRRP